MNNTQPAKGANGDSMRTAMDVDALRAMIRRAARKNNNSGAMRHGRE